MFRKSTRLISQKYEMLFTLTQILFHIYLQGAGIFQAGIASGSLFVQDKTGTLDNDVRT